MFKLCTLDLRTDAIPFVDHRCVSSASDSCLCICVCVYVFMWVYVCVCEPSWLGSAPLCTELCDIHLLTQVNLSIPRMALPRGDSLLMFSQLPHHHVARSKPPTYGPCEDQSHLSYTFPWLTNSLATTVQGDEPDTLYLVLWRAALSNIVALGPMMGHLWPFIFTLHEVKWKPQPLGEAGCMSHALWLPVNWHTRHLSIITEESSERSFNRQRGDVPLSCAHPTKHLFLCAFLRKSLLMLR